MGGRHFPRAKRRPQLQRWKNNAEKEVRAVRLIEQQRILPQPPQARVLRRYTLLDGPGVHIGARLKWLREPLSQPHSQRLQPLQKHIMIVVSPSVARNPTSRLVFPAGELSVRGERVVGVVAEQANDNAAYSRSEEHTSELQSQSNLVCRLLLEKKKKQ